MKTSDALLAGFAKVNGRQCMGRMYERDENHKVIGHCLIGSIIQADNDHSNYHEGVITDIFGMTAIAVNDRELMDWRDVVGILQSEGL